MTTYSIREFKAKAGKILRDLDDGGEVIITLRGKPCGKLTSIQPSKEGKPSLGALRGAFASLPDANYEDFLGNKELWATAAPVV